MVSRAATYDIDFGQAFDFVRSEFYVVEHDFVVFYARGKHRRQRARLLVYLFQHKVRIAVLFGGSLVPIDDYGFALDFLHVAVENVHRRARNAHDFALAEQNKAASVAEKRRHIGGDEILAVAQPHDERTVLAHSVERVGRERAQHAERVGAHQLVQHFAHAVEHIPVVVVLEKVRDNFGVGFRAELIAASDKKLPQLDVVFDNSVVHDCELAVARQVRMRIDVVRLAVSSPARVSHAHVTRKRLAAVGFVHERGQPPFGFDHLDFARFVHYRDAARVIAAIFEFFQSVDKHRRGLFPPGKSYDSAHVFLFSPFVIIFRTLFGTPSAAVGCSAKPRASVLPTSAFDFVV